MGIIERQGFKSIVVTYFFTVIAVLSNLIIYPYVLEVSEFGTISFLTTTAASMAPFLLLGFHVMYLKYFSVFEDTPHQKNVLFSIVIWCISFITLLFITGYLLFRSQIIAYYQETNNVDSVTLDLIAILSTVIPYLNLYTYISSTYGRISIPAILNNLIKLVQPILVAFYFFQFINFYTVLIAIVVFHFVLLIAFIYLQRKIDPLKLSYNFKEFAEIPSINKMVNYAFYGFAIGVGSVLITNIDIIMISTTLGLEQNGIYTWGLFVVGVVAIPYQSITNIASPIIAKHLQNENFNDINILYKQSSTILLLVSLGLFLSIYLSIDDLFEIMPKGEKYSEAKGVLLILGIAKIIDISFGLNGQIIAYSKYYKVMITIMIVTASLNIGLNYILIKKFEIIGAAIATLTSLSLFNFLKYFFIKKRFNLSPLSIKFVQIPILGIVLFFIIFFIPKSPFPLLNMAYRSGLFLIVYGILAYFFNLSEEYSNFVKKNIFIYFIR